MFVISLYKEAKQIKNFSQKAIITYFIFKLNF